MTLAAASAFAMPIYGEIQPFTGWMYILAGAIYPKIPRGRHG